VRSGAEWRKVEDDRGEGADRWGRVVSEGGRKKKGVKGCWAAVVGRSAGLVELVGLAADFRELPTRAKR
jgi:hypothetical protein